MNNDTVKRQNKPNPNDEPIKKSQINTNSSSNLPPLASNPSASNVNADKDKDGHTKRFSDVIKNENGKI